MKLRRVDFSIVFNCDPEVGASVYGVEPSVSFFSCWMFVSTVNNTEK
jgi:hypothetical protein